MKVRQIILSVATLLCGFTFALPAFADTLYSQPVDLVDGLYSNPNLFVVYDEFTLSAGATVTSVDWYGTDAQGSTSPTSFTIGLYSDNAGLPGILLASSVVGNGSPSFDAIDAGGFSVNQYSSTITPFTATAGTQYWLSIVANSDWWAWEISTNDNGEVYSYSDNTPGLVESAAGGVAFTLYGTPSATPEPSSLMLLGTGLLGAAGLARRRLLGA